MLNPISDQTVVNPTGTLPDYGVDAAALPTSLWVDGDDAEQSSVVIPSSLWIVGIVVALPEELATLTNHKPVQGECFAINDNIKVVYSGAGPVNAERCAEFLIHESVNCLISWGCAAALSPDLKPGDVVLPKQVYSCDQQILATDQVWLKQIESVLSGKMPISTGNLAESNRIVASSSHKLSIHKQTGAVALDMESAAVLKAALAAKLPCLIIRTIADPVDMDLPQAVLHSLNSQGNIELSKLFRFLLTHPWQIPALIKLGLHFNLARKSLKKIAQSLGDIINFNTVTHE